MQQIVFTSRSIQNFPDAHSNPNAVHSADPNTFTNDALRENLTSPTGSDSKRCNNQNSHKASLLRKAKDWFKLHGGPKSTTPSSPSSNTAQAQASPSIVRHQTNANSQLSATRLQPAILLQPAIPHQPAQAIERHNVEVVNTLQAASTHERRRDVLVLPITNQASEAYFACKECCSIATNEKLCPAGCSVTSMVPIEALLKVRVHYVSPQFENAGLRIGLSSESFIHRSKPLSKAQFEFPISSFFNGIIAKINGISGSKVALVSIPLARLIPTVKMRIIFKMDTGNEKVWIGHEKNRPKSANPKDWSLVVMDCELDVKKPLAYSKFIQTSANFGNEVANNQSVPYYDFRFVIISKERVSSNISTIRIPIDSSALFAITMLQELFPMNGKCKLSYVAKNCQIFTLKSFYNPFEYSRDSAESFFVVSPEQMNDARIVDGLNRIPGLVICSDCERKTKQIEDLAEKYAASENTVKELQEKYANNNSESEELKEKSTRNDNKVKELQAKVDGNKLEFRNLRLQLDESNNEIHELQQKASTKESKFQELQVEFSKKDNEIQNLQSQLKDAFKEIETLKQQIASSNFPSIDCDLSLNGCLPLNELLSPPLNSCIDSYYANNFANQTRDLKIVVAAASPISTLASPPTLQSCLKRTKTAEKKRTSISFEPRSIFFEKVSAGTSEEVDEFIEENPGFNLRCCMVTGLNALHHAAISSNVSTLRGLLRHVELATFINEIDQAGWTPLHYAANADSLDIVQILVENGANIDYRDEENKRPIDVAEDDAIIAYLTRALQIKLSVDKVVCLHAWTAKDTDEITTEIGDILEVLDRGTDVDIAEWWEVMDAKGKKGFIPRVYVGTIF